MDLTNQQARRFMLLKQGLLGEYRFIGKQGAAEFVRQAGSIQFDPVDVCGKNAELTLQSRVKGFTKRILYELLYEDRMLVDFPDKNLSIFLVEDWPYFERYRKAARESGGGFPGLAGLREQAREYIAQNGAVSSDELPIEGDIYWHSAIHWSGMWGEKTNAARSVLEQLYSEGELVIHHKQGARKFYDLAGAHIPAGLLTAPDPLEDDFEHLKWRLLRRISAVGLLWNRPSDAWLNIWGLKGPERNRAFEELLEEGKILEIRVEGIKNCLYCNAGDLSLAERVLGGEACKARCEFLAPLDCFLWDRRLIKELFGFDYRWEIYTPAAKRKYGFYVLPVLYGEQFVGRIEAAADKKSGVLSVKNFWYEDGVRQTKKLSAEIAKCVKRFAKFNECRKICDCR